MTAPLPDDVAGALAALGYDRRWLDLGLLDTATPMAQLADFDRGDDPHAEHHRYKAITAFLAATPLLSDNLLDGIVHLLRIDPDQVMASSVRAHHLLPHPGLTDAQFQRIASLPEVEQHSPREARRARLVRRLAAGEWSPDLVERCLTDGDSIVHRGLLAHPRLDRATLLALSTRGVNKAIRNHAAHLLRSRRFRDL